MDLLDRLKEDPSPSVRGQALHVFEDAAELQSEGYPTHPREATDAMLRERRASRDERNLPMAGEEEGW